MEENIQAGEPRPQRSMLDTSRLWYAALVPLFGIYIEMYARSFLLGVLVWGMAIIMGPAACLLDRRYLKRTGTDVSALKPVCALLPPLYMYKRIRLTGGQPVCMVVCCIMIVYAAMMNGFTTALTMSEKTITSKITNIKWSYIVETSDVSCDKTVSESLEELSGGTLTWSGSRTSEGLTVAGTAENGFEARFLLDFDGYRIHDAHLLSVRLDGADYEGEAAAALIKERFDTSESQSEDSAAEDTEGSAADEETEDNADEQAA